MLNDNTMDNTQSYSSKNAIAESTSTNMLERASQATAVVSGLTVLAAIFYNWAYFSTVAPSVGQILTISDQVSSALRWLPATALSYCLGLFVNICFVGGRSLQHSGPKRVVHYLAVISLVLCFFISSSLDWVGMIGFAALWMGYMIHVAPLDTFDSNLRLPVLIAVTLLAISLSTGNNDGLNDLNNKDGNATITTANGHQISNAIVLREIDKGALLHTISDNKVIFVPWDDIKELSVSSNVINHHANICIYFGVLCSLQNPR